MKSVPLRVYRTPRVVVGAAPCILAIPVLAVVLGSLSLAARFAVRHASDGWVLEQAAGSARGMARVLTFLGGESNCNPVQHGGGKAFGIVACKRRIRSRRVSAGVPARFCLDDHVVSHAERQLACGCDSVQIAHSGHSHRDQVVAHNNVVTVA